MLVPPTTSINTQHMTAAAPHRHARPFIADPVSDVAQPTPRSIENFKANALTGATCIQAIGSMRRGACGRAEHAKAVRVVVTEGARRN
jgi:hypothetical protein